MKKKHTVKSQYSNPDGHIKRLQKKIDKLEHRKWFLTKLLGNKAITWENTVDIHMGMGLLPPEIKIGDGIRIVGVIIKTTEELDQNDGQPKFSYSFRRESTNILPMFIDADRVK